MFNIDELGKKSEGPNPQDPSQEAAIRELESFFKIVAQYDGSTLTKSLEPGEEHEILRNKEVPLGAASIEHIQLDCELLDPVTNYILGRPWLTIMVDEASKLVLAHSTSLEPPSYVSLLRVLNECEKHLSRLPQIIITDRGIDCTNGIFQEFLEKRRITHIIRPPDNLRLKSVCERVFKEINTELSNNHERDKTLSKTTGPQSQ